VIIQKGNLKTHKQFISILLYKDLSVATFVFVLVKIDGNEKRMMQPINMRFLNKNELFLDRLISISNSIKFKDVS
jgi:hypothetical protein